MIGATGPQMMELTGGSPTARCSTTACRRNTTSSAMGNSKGGGQAGRSIDDIDRPQLVVCPVHDDRSRCAGRRANFAHAVPRPAAAHRQASGRQAEVVQQIQSILGWLATQEQVRGDEARARRTGAAHHRQRHAGISAKVRE